MYFLVVMISKYFDIAKCVCCMYTVFSSGLYPDLQAELCWLSVDRYQIMSVHALNNLIIDLKSRQFYLSKYNNSHNPI